MGNTCNLPAPVYGEVAALILERTNWRVIVTGSAGEKTLTDSWPPAVLPSPRVYNAMGAFGLRMLAAMISQMSNYVIVGTGPLHLAAAVGIPTTSPFCALPPLSPSVWGNVLTGACAEPSSAGCREWRQTHPGLCDFRGEVTAESLWQLLRLKTGESAKAASTSRI